MCCICTRYNLVGDWHFVVAEPVLRQHCTTFLPLEVQQFCRATLSCDKVAVCNCMSHKQALTKLIGQCLFMRQSCSVRHATQSSCFEFYSLLSHCWLDIRIQKELVTPEVLYWTKWRKKTNGKQIAEVYLDRGILASKNHGNSNWGIVDQGDITKQMSLFFDVYKQTRIGMSSVYSEMRLWAASGLFHAHGVATQTVMSPHGASFNMCPTVLSCCVLFCVVTVDPVHSAFMLCVVLCGDARSSTQCCHAVCCLVVMVDPVHGRDEGVPQLAGVPVMDCCQGQSWRGHGVRRTGEDSPDWRKSWTFNSVLMYFMCHCLNLWCLWFSDTKVVWPAAVKIHRRDHRNQEYLEKQLG